MTVREQIRKVMSESNYALYQIEIAFKGDLVPSSVRREMQGMERRGEILRDGYGKGATFTLPKGDVTAPVVETPSEEIPQGFDNNAY